MAANPPVDEGLFHLATRALSLDTRTDPDDPWSGWYLERRPRVRPRNDRRRSRRRRRRGRSRAGPVTYVHARLLRLPPLQPARPDGAAQHARGARRMARRRSAAARAAPVGRRTGRAARVRFPKRARGPGRRHVQRRRRSLAEPPGASATASRSRRSSTAAICRSTSRAWEDWPHHYRSAHGDVAWVLFADAGRGWIVGHAGTARSTYSAAARFRRFRRSAPTSALGLDFGGIGIYAAKAVSTPAEPMNFFVRLRHRF